MEKHPTADLAVYAVWLPVLPGDERAAWDERLLPDTRVTHFWDEQRLTGFWFARQGYLEGQHFGFVWDAYLLFGPEAKWESKPLSLMSEGTTVIGKSQNLRESLVPLLSH